MDVNNNKKVQLSGIFNNFGQVQNTYNPALHKETKDSISLNNSMDSDVKEIYDELQKTREEQGIVGKLWDGFKNLTKIGAGSNKVEEAIKKYQNGQITKEEVEQILANYQDGQKTCLDVVADMASSIVAVGAFALAVPTGGTSLPAGLAISTGISTVLKVGIKGIDAKANGREYNSKNLLYDVATGAVNGLLAPVTNGIGSSLTKTIGCKLGLTVTGDVLEAGAKNTLKSLIVNQSIDVAGGTMKKRALALGAGMAVDGALGGTADNVVREVVEEKENKNVLKSAVEGFVGGLIMSPVIGGGFRLAGKLGKNIGDKIFHRGTPDVEARNNIFIAQNNQGADGDVNAEVIMPTKPIEAEAETSIKSKEPDTPAQEVNANAGKGEEAVSELPTEPIKAEEQSVVEVSAKEQVEAQLRTDTNNPVEEASVSEESLNTPPSPEPKAAEAEMNARDKETNTPVQEVKPDTDEPQIDVPAATPITKEEVKAKIKQIEIAPVLKVWMTSNMKTQWQIDFVDKIVSDSNLFKNPSVMNNIEEILSSIDSPEKARAMTSIIEKYVSDPKLFENQSLQKEIGDIILRNNTSEHAQATLGIINKYLSEPKLYENQRFQNKIGGIVLFVNSPECAKAKLSIIDKYLSESKLYENQGLQDKIADIIYFLRSPEEGKVKLDIIELYLSDSNLHNHQVLQECIADIIYCVRDNKGINSILETMNKYLSSPKLFENKELQKNIGYIIGRSNAPEKAIITEKFFSNPKLYENKKLPECISCLLRDADIPEKVKLTEKFFSDPNLYENEWLQKNLGEIFYYAKNPNQVTLIEKILLDPKLLQNQWIKTYIRPLLSCADMPEKAIVIEKFLSNPKLYENQELQNNFIELLTYLKTPERATLAAKFFSEPNLYENQELQQELLNIIIFTRDTENATAKISIMDKYISEPKLYENKKFQNSIADIINTADTSEDSQAMLDVIDRYISNPKLYGNRGLQEQIGDIILRSNAPERAQAKLSLLDKYVSEPKLYKNKQLQEKIAMIVSETFTIDAAQVKLRLLDKYVSEPKLYRNKVFKDGITDIVRFTNTSEQAEIKLNLIDIYLSGRKLFKNKRLQKNIVTFIDFAKTQEKAKVIQTFLSDSKLYENEKLHQIIFDYILKDVVTPEQAQAKCDIMSKFISDAKLYDNEVIEEAIGDIIGATKTPEHAALAEKLLSDVVKGETTPKIAVAVLQNYGTVSYSEVEKLRKTISPKLFDKIYNNPTDLVAAANMVGLYGKNNINEIPLAEKRNIVRGMVKNNTDLFSISDDLKQAFPLIPKTQEEYCAILPSLVKSLGIEVKPLTVEQVGKFNTEIAELSSSLAKLSDDEFNNLVISQAYSKDEFITDTLAIVKNLSDTERQKVYDYFGFELHHNKKAPVGYSITGYPVNINNGAKLAQITDENTKEVVETLRKKVIAFSKNNPIQSNNPQINQLLDDIFAALPELHSTIDRLQYGSHEFDVLKHSLKVMQKITQNPKYEKLNPSDKKIMLLASLLHDITKAEIKADPMHNFESSFDAFYITKKFNLTQDEQIKLYTLINHHEWLKYVNKNGISEEELRRRLQSVAFDLQNDNLFEMAKIFTEADLKGIKQTDGLFNTYSEALDKYSKEIEALISELQLSKPILPTTKLPKASEIASRITIVNADGSTNIKGVYKKDGLIVVKYNEVENWEALGFAKGSMSKGIKTTNPVNNSEIDTGNIKFIAHGLEYSNQLSNFDAFALPDSDALLSVSYMERPESKYRLFRTQGVLLDVDSKYMHGGGETDSGSGCGKSINDFKTRYIFGGERQTDRDYISDLIKETLGLNDEEYVKFIQTNQNKSMLEIEPAEAREALIKKFALINSNKRRGNREYNEMYVSNPKVQGCFAYSSKDKVGNISSFIDAQESFLKDYARKNDLPFFVFGD